MPKLSIKTKVHGFSDSCFQIVILVILWGQKQPFLHLHANRKLMKLKSNVVNVNIITHVQFQTLITEYITVYY